jgi:DNA modification methylase
VILTDRLWQCSVGDCRKWLADFQGGSIHCAVTSPPYWGLRDYGHPEQLGLEQTPEQYVANMVSVFREVRRVLHPSGVLWLNLGDSFCSGGRVGHGERVGDKQKTNRGMNGTTDPKRAPQPDGLKPKDLVGIPWMVAFALRADGWYLRQHCPWVKVNAMPESVEDRPGTSCEEVFLFSKNPDYFYDVEAVKRPASTVPASASAARRRRRDNGSVGTTGLYGQLNGQSGKGENEDSKGETRNFRNADLWFDSVGMLLSDDGTALGIDVPVKGLKAAHFAVMPESLVEPLILAGTSAKGVCPQCGEPWTRVVEKDRKATRPGDGSKVRATGQTGGAYKPPGQSPHSNARHDSEVVGNRDPERHVTTTRTVGWESGCKCEAGDPVPAVVLDPFTGAGTVAKVAVHHGRRFVGCELNPDYMKIIERRMRGVTPPLFANV